MQVVVLFGHPNPGSFNGAILDAVTEELTRMGAVIKVKDLYSMGFNPVLTGSDLAQIQAGTPPQDIAREQEDIRWADVVVMISPVWWHGVTSMLRGYIDRVFSYGFAYTYTANGAEGLLKGKKGYLITTSGADAQADKITGMTDDIRRTFVDGFYKFCGFEATDYMNCFGVTMVTDADRRQMVEEVRSFIRQRLG